MPSEGADTDDTGDEIGTMTNRRASLVAPFVGALTAIALLIPTVASEAQQMRRGESLLSALEREVRGLVDAVSPSVVTIRSACKVSGTPSNPGPSSLSIGSGLILDTTGRIVTSARVVDNADEFWVETFDERIFPALLLGTSGDVAVLQIDATDLKPAQFGDAGDLDVGSFVAAVGNSYGFACGLAWGEVNGFRPDGTIQLSLGVSAGSSGGAIVDTRGYVVGLIKAKISEPYYIDVPFGASSSGGTFASRRLELPTSSVSLAIPIGHVLRLAHNVSESGTGAPAYVGVYVDDLAGWQVEHFKTASGVLIVGVVAGSPAQRYGLSTGDIIRSVGADTIESVRRFRQVIVQSRPGERLTFNVLRDGRPLKVTLETARAELPDLGVALDPIPITTARPVPVSTGRTDLREAAPNPSIERRRMASSSSNDDIVNDPDTEARLRGLELVVDSLLREIESLHRNQKP